MLHHRGGAPFLLRSLWYRILGPLTKHLREAAMSRPVLVSLPVCPPAWIIPAPAGMFAVVSDLYYVVLLVFSTKFDLQRLKRFVTGRLLPGCAGGGG
jgi:hypothetical protein